MSMQAEPGGAFDPAVLLRESEWLRALAHSLVGSPDEAEDLVQETWIQALRSQPQGSGLRPWLRRVLRNLVISRRRRSAWIAGGLDVTEGSLPDPHSTQVEPSDLVERAELQRLLVGWVLELEEDQRDTLLMHFHGGLSPRDIAVRGAVSPSTIRSRLKRGLDRLRVRADEQGGAEGRCAILLGPLLVAPRMPWPIEGTPSGPTPPRPTPGVSPPQATTPLFPSATLLGGVMTTKSVFGLGLVVLSALAIYFGSRPQAPPQSTPDIALAGAESTGSEIQGVPPSDALKLPGAPGDGRAEVLAPTPSESNDSGDETAPGRPPLRGVILDETHGLPLPAFGLRVEGAHPGGAAEPQVEILHTDAIGGFQGKLHWGPGPLRFEFTDHDENHDLLNRDYRRQGVEVERRVLILDPEDTGAVGGLEVPTGPSFELNFDPPPGTAVEDFVATFRCARPDQAWDRFRSPLRNPGDEGRGRPWVRFPSVAPLIQGIPPYGILLQSRDGLWEGFAEVGDHRSGPCSTPVALEVQPRGRLQGRLESDTGKPLNTWVILDRIQGETGPEEVRYRTSPPFHEGRFSIAGIPAGEYQLKADVEGYGPIRQTVEIRGGEDRVLDLIFEPSGNLVPLRGTVTSQSGAYDRPTSVHAVQRSPPFKLWSTEVEWRERGGSLQGRFRIEDLPEGVYVVQLALPEASRIDPAAQEVTLPSKRISFEILDTEPSFDLVLNVESEAEGDPVEDARVILWSEELGELAWQAIEVAEPSGPDRERTGALHFINVPDLPDLRWRFDTIGWQGETGFVEDFPLQGGTRRGSIEVREGRSLQLHVVDATGLDLAGVEVWVAGHKHGETDATGRFELRRKGPFRTVDLHHPAHPSWRILPDQDGDADSPGQVSISARSKTLVLGPPGD